MGKAVGQPRKNPEDIRSVSVVTLYTEAEKERIDWAAKELGLSPAAFQRMAALREAKQVLG